MIRHPRLDCGGLSSILPVRDLEETVAASVLHLTLKMVIALVVGRLSGLALFKMLPAERGLAITRSGTELFVSLARIGLWACLTSGVVVANAIFVRAAIKDVWLK